VHSDGADAERAECAGGRDRQQPAEARAANRATGGHGDGYDARVEISPAWDWTPITPLSEDAGALFGYDGVLVVGHNPNVFQFLDG